MVKRYAPLAVNRTLSRKLDALRLRQLVGEDARRQLGALLQAALTLEFATIPVYLSAAFSLDRGNDAIQRLITRIAIEEMLHFTIVANTMNAIGIAPDVEAAVPTYPFDLDVLDPPLHLELKSYTPDLVEELFLQIETPRNPILFTAELAGANKTVGEFYEGIINIIESATIPDLFDVNPATRNAQVIPPSFSFRSIAYRDDNDRYNYPLHANIDFAITDAASAVHHLKWLVDQGEGTSKADTNPIDSSGLPAHYYRFVSILKGKYLVADPFAALGYAYKGGTLRFDSSNVHDCDPNSRAADYAEYPQVQQSMNRFNQSYAGIIDTLQTAFTSLDPAVALAAYNDSLGFMRRMPNQASAIYHAARQARIKAGLPFERPHFSEDFAIPTKAKRGVQSMGFPNDLSDVAVFKVHPAIGVARLANNDDYYEFFDYHAKRLAGEAATLEYMSVHDGHRRMKRQAVQFKIFAYDAAGWELGELTSENMARLGLEASWTATVANRKLNNWSHGATPVVLGTATARGAHVLDLEGDNPWHTSKVWLGTLTGTGTFLPPKGGVYRQDADKVIPPYGFHQQDNGVLDTTSDGSINVDLGDIGGRPIVPACIIVAPQDHSPDVKAAQLGGSNEDFVQSTRRLLGIAADAQLAGKGYAMDVAMMDTLNADYNPGMELCLEESPPSNALPDPAAAFYPRGQGAISEHEIRPSYEAGNANYGALTAGLCSTWQTDLNACLDYWTAEYPNRLQFDTSPEERFLSRAIFASEGPRMDDPEMLNAYIDIMGVGRDEQDNPFSLFERERTATDNAGAQPQAPFPLDPPR